MPPASSTSDPLRPTRARYKVMGFAVVLAIITYVDRVCISQAAGDIRQDLGFGPTEMGWIFSVFALAYSLFEIPGGWMGDRYGPRSVLLKVVGAWSFFTMATGWAWNFWSMLICRFLFGAGEAGCFPNLTKIFTIWLPSVDRVRAQGILWLFARWGGAFTPPLVGYLLIYVNWRWTFGIFGLIGIVWAVVFARWFRDRPAEHPGVNAAELALMDGAESNAPSHEPMPWGRLLSCPSVWLLWLQYFCVSYGWYFYITWLPTYLREARNMPIEKSAWFSSLPLFFGGIGCFVGGWAARRLVKSGVAVRTARKGVACTGLIGAGSLLLLVPHVNHPILAIITLGFASFANDLSIANGWGACMDVGGRYAGSVSGSMNMMGNFGGAVGPTVVGYILAHSRATPDSLPTLAGWDTAFVVAAAIYGVGALVWLFIDPVTPLNFEPKKPTPTGELTRA